MERIVVPAREGRAVELAKGRRIRVITPRGAQAADFFAYNAANVAEWLSPMHSWVASRHLGRARAMSSAAASGGPCWSSAKTVPAACTT